MVAAIFFSILASLLFAFATQNMRNALAHLDDLTGTFISVATMAVVFWVLSAPGMEWAFWSSPAIWFFAVAGLLFPALGQRFQISSVKHVGPALTSAIGSFLPVFAVVPAVVFLGETVTPMIAAGIALLVGALFYAALGRGVSWRTRGFYLILLPLGAAIVRATTQPMTKAGYDILPEPIFATALMASVSTVVVGAMVLAFGTPRRLIEFGRGHALFVLNGLLIGSGIASLQVALVTGTVSLTASLTSVTPIWVVLLGVFVFRHETLTWRHGAVAVACCVGAILVVLGQTP